MFEQPLNFVRKVKHGKHIVLFYEEAEYARVIFFEFTKKWPKSKRALHFQGMSGAGTEAINNKLLSIHQIPNLAASSPQIALENLHS
jgi:hypothetical protein